MVSFIASLINYIIFTTNTHNIDESHGLSHSMIVLNNAHNILEYEIESNPFLQKQTKIIYVSALLHDMCDRKYIEPDIGLKSIQEFLNEKMDEQEIEVSKKIMNSISYSKVKQNGYPDFGDYQLAYHIVREADLLAGYDFDRCIIYDLKKNNNDIHESFQNAYDLFNKRMLRYHQENLFITSYSKKESIKLHCNALNRISNWEKILKNPLM